MLACLRVKKLRRDGDMPMSSPSVRTTARLLANAETLGCNAAMGDGSLELRSSLLELLCSTLQVVLRHEATYSLRTGVA